MPIYFAWAKEKIANLYPTARTLAGQALQGIATVTNILIAFVPQPISKLVSDIALQAWDALRMIGNRSAIQSLRQSPQTQKDLLQAAYTNFVLYALPALISRELFEYAQPNEDATDTYEQVYNTLAVITFYVMLRRWIRMNLINNPLYAMNVSQSVVKENPNNEKIFPLSKSDKLEKYWADIIQLIIYYIDKGAAHLVFYIPRMLAWVFSSLTPYTFYSDWISRGMHSYTYGRGFIDYKNSLLQMNALERKNTNTSNKITLLVYGAVFAFLVEGTNLLIARRAASEESFFYNVFFSLENSFINSAFYNFYFQSFIVLSYLMQQPLRHSEGGLDVFFPTSKATQFLLNKTSERLVKLFRSRGQFNWQQVLQQGKAIVSSSSFEFTAGLLLDNNLLSLNKAVRDPVIKLFLDHYENEIKSVPAFIQDVRQNLWVKALNWLPLNWYGIRNLVIYFKGQIILDVKKGIALATNDNLNPVVGAMDALCVARKEYHKEVSDQKHAEQMKTQEELDEIQSRELAKVIERAEKEKEVKIILGDILEMVESRYLVNRIMKAQQNNQKQEVELSDVPLEILSSQQASGLSSTKDVKNAADSHPTVQADTLIPSQGLNRHLTDVIAKDFFKQISPPTMVISSAVVGEQKIEDDWLLVQDTHASDESRNHLPHAHRLPKTANKKSKSNAAMKLFRNGIKNLNHNVAELFSKDAHPPHAKYQK